MYSVRSSGESVSAAAPIVAMSTPGTFKSMQ